MRHKAKIDLWFAIAIVFAIVVPVAQEHYWIALPPVLILVTCCCPQSYETTAQGLMVRAGFVRRLIPYDAITFIGPGWDGRASLALSLDRVKIRYGPWSELLIAPENPDAFYADMAAHAPHLTRRGQELVR